VSIAYAIWAGLGTAFITVIGIFWFREPSSAFRLISLAFVVMGVIGLHLSDRVA
jgi:small multidrug resistance pump